MSTTTLAPDSTERVSFQRLLWVGPLTVLAAVAANVIFVSIANPLFGVSPDFPALTAEAIAAFTAVGVIAAVVVFALVARLSKRPIWLLADCRRGAGALADPGPDAAVHGRTVSGRPARGAPAHDHPPDRSRGLGGDADHPDA